jgi:hypothetical protein
VPLNRNSGMVLGLGNGLRLCGTGMYYAHTSTGRVVRSSIEGVIVWLRILLPIRVDKKRFPSRLNEYESRTSTAAAHNL